MRIFVFILALVGIGGSGFLAYKWQSEVAREGYTVEGAQKKQDQIEQQIAIRGSNPVLKDKLKVAKKEEVRARSWMYIAGAAVAGLLGAILVLMSRGILGALLMIPLPIFVAYFDIVTLIFTGALVLAGCLAVFVWPKPKDEEEEEEAHDPVPRARRSTGNEMISSFECAACRSVLKTGKPVPVGKKIRCPKCKEITPIRAMPVTAKRKAAQKSAKEPQPTRGPRAAMGWLFLLLAVGGSGALMYLTLKTDVIKNFLQG